MEIDPFVPEWASLALKQLRNSDPWSPIRLTRNRCRKGITSRCHNLFYDMTLCKLWDPAKPGSPGTNLSQIPASGAIAAAKGSRICEGGTDVHWNRDCGRACWLRRVIRRGAVVLWRNRFVLPVDWPQTLLTIRPAGVKGTSVFSLRVRHGGPQPQLCGGRIEAGA